MRDSCLHIDSMRLRTVQISWLKRRYHRVVLLFAPYVSIDVPSRNLIAQAIAQQLVVPPDSMITWN